MGGGCRVLYVGADTAHAERLERELTQFDCLVVRYDLTDMTGVELVERVRRQAPDIPSILVARRVASSDPPGSGSGGPEASQSLTITVGATETGIYVADDGTGYGLIVIIVDYFRVALTPGLARPGKSLHESL